MAVIAISKRTTQNFAVTPTTMTSSDTLAYVKGNGHGITFTNPTGSPVVVTMLGNGGVTSTPGPVGYGGSISLASGYALTVPANSIQHLVLDNIYLFLQGTSVALTGGTGLTASVLSN